jgi:hypothetical protein
LDKSFSSLSRIGWVQWVIFKSLKNWRSHFQVTQDLDEVWHPVFGFLNSKGFRKLKERTWQEGQVSSRLGWVVVVVLLPLKKT